MRDVKSEDTIYIGFTTRSFATGSPATLAGTPVVSAYENASLTQITAGITLSVDHDGVTGFHMLTIVATAANGYDTGNDYNLVITTGTVGGVSVVGEVVGRFSLDRSPAAQDLANGTDGLGAIKTDTAAILVDTADMQPKLGTPATNVSADIAAVKADTAAILTDTADMQPKLGTPAASVSADIAAIKAQTDSIGAAGAGLTAIPWNASWDAEVQSEVNDGLVALGLDHLLSAAVVGTDVTDNSIIAYLASKGATADWDTYVNTTDSLEASRDKLTDIETDTQDLQTQVGTAGAGLTDLGGMSTGMKAEINTEALDVLNTDTITLPGQTAPPATPTVFQAMGWLYKCLRNRTAQTATQWSLYADDETTVDAKATVSDDATTAIKQEVVSGP